ncbi:suppressor APC domain-containing protein 2 isoform X2 [Silurus meridionalis]|uniref:suppressor APC domain-containing protein 2 isoform X2 n=1 Tax=Silurus meridionalis TaxID=175797 RepID=UPI001EEA9B80|nr:suppressor APC domain-containing protein 2 isoform X2 [Silurus meridionalis]
MALIAADPRCKPTGLSCISAVRNECVENKPKALKNPGMQSQDAEWSEGLPKAFLHSLRTLFDILDDGKRGFVHISEIESRWQGAEAQDLPGGVLESLRRIAPPHGCLTFERFVAGLRSSILHPDIARPPNHAQKQHFLPNGFRVRPLGPSNGTNVHHGGGRDRDRGRAYASASKRCASDSSSYANSGAQPCTRNGRSLERVHAAPDRADSFRGQGPTRVQSAESISVDPIFHKPGQQHGERVGLPRSQSESTTGFAATRRHSRSREEPRRHTITNGVDYGMLKQMKELEQEKDSLLSGLDVVERAREWYQSQIHNVNERQRLIGQSGHLTDFLTESNQCRLNVLLPKLQEVNRCLSELISCSGMTSIVSPSVPPVPAPPQAIQRLKDQNHLLTKEVTEKSERITQLEQEKSALIKQLFEARARTAHENSVFDSTFI